MPQMSQQCKQTQIPVNIHSRSSEAQWSRCRISEHLSVTLKSKTLRPHHRQSSWVSRRKCIAVSHTFCTAHCRRQQTRTTLDAQIDSGHCAFSVVVLQFNKDCYSLRYYMLESEVFASLFKCFVVGHRPHRHSSQQQSVIEIKKRVIVQSI